MEENQERVSGVSKREEETSALVAIETSDVILVALGLTVLYIWLKRLWNPVKVSTSKKTH